MLKLSVECNYLIVKSILKVRAAYGEHVVCVSGSGIGGYAPRSPECAGHGVTFGLGFGWNWGVMVCWPDVL